MESGSHKEAKNWLQRLKDESWEAELLVSAVAIFGTFQLFDGINWITNFFINTVNPNQYFVAYFICFFGLIAVSALAAMFVIHFFLRAYWVGLVGLNSVFPDYSLEDSAYSKIYTEKILSILPKLKDSIQKVDELCSVIFSIAFTFLLLYGYIAFFSSLYLLIYNMLSEYINSYILMVPAIFIGLSLFVQIIISVIANLKKNQEKEKLQLLSFKVVKFVSMISFGPIYKSILQVTMIFGSNFKKKKSLVYLIFVFLISAMLVAVIQLPKTNILYLVRNRVAANYDIHKTYADYYKDSNRQIEFLLSPEIESDFIERNTLEVFIPIFDYESSMRDVVCGTFEEISSNSRKEKSKNRAIYLEECYKKYHKVFLNEEKIEVTFLRYNNHYRTNQFGIIAFIDISKLPVGLNALKIEKINGEGAFLKWNIPFYYAPKN
ncbi:hypothetical protein SAMN04489761_2173 [Tenacibaculum sp. MAR_2009_124]|uniref:hypothetical protein n=1 Tax=Tenacibaculum sp. MAR_2009_124 TaxID=1250059 RepID=UPI00089D97FB|nr:hypothetical protein [Tenacibaculum sp. MAR_2009_124]SEB98713.1 hypothetical protein SAMN04489761_2173 [Tenacibaculum sp. MAR_2009_124]